MPQLWLPYGDGESLLSPRYNDHPFRPPPLDRHSRFTRRALQRAVLGDAGVYRGDDGDGGEG